MKMKKQNGGKKKKQNRAKTKNRNEDGWRQQKKGKNRTETIKKPVTRTTTKDEETKTMNRT
jgi:hypothetical protein